MENAKGINVLLLGLGSPSGDENQQEFNSQSPLGFPGSVRLKGGQETGKADDEMAMLTNDHRLEGTYYSTQRGVIIWQLYCLRGSLEARIILGLKDYSGVQALPGLKNSLLTFVASYLKLYMK